MKENVKKFSERTKNLREILEEYRQFEVYYDPVEENVAFTNYQTAKFFRGLGFEVLVVSKEEDKELEKEFEIIKVEV